MLEAVTGNLPAKCPEFGADGSKVGVGKIAKRFVAHALYAVSRESNQLSGTCEHFEFDDVVRSSTVAQRAWAAGIIADHAADCASICSRRIRAEPQSVRLCCLLQRRLNNPRLYGCRLLLRVDFNDFVQMLAHIYYKTTADGVTRARSASATSSDRQLFLQRGSNQVNELGPGFWGSHHLRNNPINRRVGRIDRLCQGGFI